MRFELTGALIDDILFSMEDQNGEFLLDTTEGVVSGGIDGADFFDENEDTGGDSRYIELPRWDSACGFRLMEHFASGFRNPLIRSELSLALSQGKGVFRAFKDTLSRYPEAEKLWFSFKEKEMKREILAWYNGLREEWGLEKIGGEPEETGDLVLEDFRFRPFREEDWPRAEELHRFCREEAKKILSESGAKNASEILLEESRALSHFPEDPAEKTAPSPGPAIAATAIAAESGGGEFAGYIAGTAKGPVFYIQNLELKAEYRGLGIGEALLARLIEGLDPNDITQVLIDLPSWSESFSRVLFRESFRPYTVRYWRDLRDRA